LFWRRPEDPDGWGQGDDSGWEEPVVAVAVKHVVKDTKGPFTVLDSFKIQERMREMISDAKGCFGVSGDYATILLRTYKWNFNALQQAWVENADKVRSKCKIVQVFPELVRAPSQDGQGNYLSPPSAVPLVAGMECSVCGDDDVETLFASDCGHIACNDCWIAWVTECMKSQGPAAVLTTCMDGKCGTILPARIFRKFLPPPQYSIYQKYVYFWTEIISNADRIGFRQYLCPTVLLFFHELCLWLFSQIPYGRFLVQYGESRRFEAHQALPCPWLQQIDRVQ
jgi:hypothetical protein